MARRDEGLILWMLAGLTASLFFRFVAIRTRVPRIRP
jgi:hypothetical protein